MGYLALEIEDAARETGVIYSKIDISQSEHIRKLLAVQFTDEGNIPQNLSWQNLRKFKSVHNPDGWKLIGEFSPEQEIILFLEYKEEKSMWRFKTGSDLVVVLSECIGFPFCITSEKGDYVICFDDHDCLIGAGSAVSWIEQIPTQ